MMDEYILLCIHMHDVYQKKAEHLKIYYIICDNLPFLSLTTWPLMTMIWPLMTFFDLSTSRKVSINIANNIIILRINWKLKTALLQWKYVQTSERSNDWPQADLHWPLMTSKLSVSKLMHDVYQKKAEHPRISFVKTFFFCALPYVPKRKV